MIFLETKHIVKKYADHLALNDVNIQVPQGEIYGLLGPNGAGKTSLIRIINRITAPDSGEVRIEGQLSSANDIYKIGYLPEERGLYKKMKVEEQAIFLARLKGLHKDEAKKRIYYWFEKFDIMSWKNKKIEELSKGMQQKIQFITTVVHDPNLLILDEPFSGFDPVNAELLKNEILELKSKGKTIILSTHNMESVESLCDKISLINKSQVVLQGSVTEIKNNFKQNIFKLTISNQSSISETPLYKVIAENQTPSCTEIFIQKNVEITNSELLKTIINTCEVISFEEQLPSMSDIFIKTVAK